LILSTPLKQVAAIKTPAFVITVQEPVSTLTASCDCSHIWRALQRPHSSIPMLHLSIQLTVLHHQYSGTCSSSILPWSRIRTLGHCCNTKSQQTR